jgi:hypothetical protein
MTVKNACNKRVYPARTPGGTQRASNSPQAHGETRAFEYSSQRRNLYRALLKGGEIAVQMGDGFDAAEIIFQGEMLVGSVRVFVR